jgi:PncC family amidohydrolase
MGTRTISQKLDRLLKSNRWSLAVAESCTGGMIAAAITDHAGSSEYFRGGVVAYSNEVKEGVLGVPGSLLRKKGAVSAEVVSEMAQGAARLFDVDCCIAVSGIAGPGGGNAMKPVGLVYIGIFFKGTTRSFKFRFTGNRKSVRQQAVEAGLTKMTEILLQPTEDPIGHKAVIFV